MISAGGYFRASVRRFLDLPPVWIDRHSFSNAAGERKTADDDGGREALAPVGSSEAPAREHSFLANARERHAGSQPGASSAKGAASRLAPSHSSDPEALADHPPVEVKDAPTCVGPKPPQGASGCSEICAPMVSTPVDRVAHGATARNGAPAGKSNARPAASRQPVPKTERITLADIASKMDKRVAELAQVSRTSSIAAPIGKAACPCAGELLFVPDWFGRDCIEARCPLRAAA